MQRGGRVSFVVHLTRVNINSFPSKGTLVHGNKGGGEAKTRTDKHSVTLRRRGPDKGYLKIPWGAIWAPASMVQRRKGPRTQNSEPKVPTFLIKRMKALITDLRTRKQHELYLYVGIPTNPLGKEWQK